MLAKIVFLEPLCRRQQIRALRGICTIRRRTRSNSCQLVDQHREAPVQSTQDREKRACGYAPEQVSPLEAMNKTTLQARDTLKVQVRNSAGTVLITFATDSNLDKNASHVQKAFNVTTYKGQTVHVYFEVSEGSTVAAQ